ncbi:phosphoinositide 3-kinase adapter protein 1 isoform X1 [Bradysia coprophila]|uniref:phosphoinositide 3-kinase adapter protein 1 isoform X1 n=1 Tax=Bradysia coprophila TaxID=38358 RepID=UPI00187DA387|nr:phosphoinositide 3-kinase adapter protein 1 isoform X1 [Bradysia coprophila]
MTSNAHPKEPCLSNGFNTVGYRCNQNQYRNRLGSYNESSSYHENDDVFVSPSRNSSQSTSVDTIDGPMSCGIRRHSIGTFVGRDRRCGSISDEVPKTYAPKPPVQMQNSLNSKMDRKASDAYGMDDILIVTSRQSEPAILWANFLKTRFDKITKQRGRQPFNFLHIKIDEIPITSDIAKRCQSTKLQIVILCSSLIALPSHFLMSQLSVLLKPDIVLGILLEVSEDKILEIHKNAALPSFKKWRRCVVKNHDQSLVGNVLGIATDILGRALCQRPPCSETSIMANKSCPNEAFTVLPRKVKLGQNKVVALLNEPLMKDDWVKVKIDKSGEMIEILNFKKRNPYTLQFSIPDSCMEVSTMIEIRIIKNEKELGSRPVKCESRLRELEYILKAQESPLEFMCHSLGINNSDRTALDAYLSQTFQKNVPPNFHLLSTTEPVKNPIFRANKDNSSEEYPTLLHFAAKWGLEHLCMQLMECPGGETACDIRNHAGKTPPELAESSGFIALSATLRSFVQMNEFTTMYHYFKGITDSNTSSTQVMIEEKSLDGTKPSNLERKESSPPISTEGYMEMSGSDQDSGGSTNAVSNLNYINVDYAKDDEVNKNLNDTKLTNELEVLTNEMKILEPDYFESNETNRTDQFSQECSNLLENCQSLNSSNESQSDYLLQPSNIPVNNGKVDNDFGDYLTQPSNRPVELKILCENANYQMQPTNRKVINPSTPIDVDHQSHLKMNFKKSNKSLVKSDSSSKASADDELLEIMNDFKNHVFTIQEVEQLVMSWKNRNDVKQSDKERQEQLEKMRCEYERIQAQMKEKMKRPTPFDRVKKFKKLFFRNKSSSSDDGNADAGDDSKTHRPMSSLSLQSISSSSSSGRMSTGSACSGASLGDSGTHSDQEERRPVFSNNTCRVGLPGSLMDNYLIPPTPRPVITPASTPTIEDRPQPIFGGTKFDLMENYSMFPSNIPVHQQTMDHHVHHDYMNFSGLNTIEETKENEVTVQPIKVQKPESVYGSITKRPSDFCSTFKPNFIINPTVVIKGENVNFNKRTDRTDDIVLSKENINEIYKNLNELDAKIQENNKKIVHAVNECHSSYANSNCDNGNERVRHEYMNV